MEEEEKTFISFTVEKKFTAKKAVSSILQRKLDKYFIK